MRDSNSHPHSPPHGFADDARAGVLRQRPSPDALRWVETSLAASVVGWQARRGGTSSAIHEVRVESPGGARTAVILRRYVLEWVVDEEPGIVRREAAALGLLEASDVAAPRALACDDTGAEAGAPAVLMTRLPGRVDWSPQDIGRWLDRMADVLLAVHATTLPAPRALPDFVPYRPGSWAPQPWLSDPALWERACEVFHARPADRERVLIHRDFHPGNVLWRRRQVSGLVDWQAASIGPGSVDVTWCKLNLLGRFGAEAAEAFVRSWERRSGREVHPWAEVVLLVDAIGGGHLMRAGTRRDFERALALALSALASR